MPNDLKTIVLIEWVDSVFDHGWIVKSDPRHAVTECRTVGFLVKKSKDKITIAQSESDESIADQITIPRCAVKKITELKTKED